MNDNMTNTTKEIVTMMLGQLTPTTLAAIVADIRDGGPSVGPYATFLAKRAEVVGVSLVGDVEFTEMVAQAA